VHVNTVQFVEEPQMTRSLGIAMVPGEHIISCHVCKTDWDDSFSRGRMADSDVQQVQATEEM
jgi:hypothetical protein